MASMVSCINPDNTVVWSVVESTVSSLNISETWKMLALVVALVYISSVYSQCSNSGCWMEAGFTFSYSRVGNDYVDIYATVETDTWVGVGISEDQLMPDTDSVVGARDGDMYFLDDRYNLNRGLPAFDPQQDITMPMVTEMDGYTSIQFRRPINSTDTERDIDLLECRWVLWAYGGAVTSYGINGTNGVFGGHSNRGVFSNQICLCANASAEDTPVITNKDCNATATTTPSPSATTSVVVTTDTPSTTGTPTATPVEPPTVPPEACSNSGCWVEDDFTFSYARVGNDYVDIYATVKTDTWIGVGFSNDKLMPLTDSVVGARDGDRYFLDDRYNFNRGLPAFDPQQDVTLRMVTEKDGYTTIEFRRPINGTDTERDINLLQCRYVLWAYGGAVTNYGTDTDSCGSNGIFGGHSAKGVFMNPICLCPDASDEDPVLITNKDCSGAASVIVSLASLMVMVVIAMFFSF